MEPFQGGKGKADGENNMELLKVLNRKNMIRFDTRFKVQEMDWRGQRGNREASLTASAAVLIRDGVWTNY